MFLHYSVFNFSGARHKQCTSHAAKRQSKKRYCNRRRRRRRPLMKLRQIQNLPSAALRTIWGPKNADVPGLQNQPHEMAFRHCLSTFVPYPLSSAQGERREREREREIVDGLIAGQKRQWSGGDWRLERKGRSKELEMRTAARTTTGSDGMTKVK